MDTAEIKDLIRKPLQGQACSLETMISSLEIIIKDLKNVRNIKEREASVARDKSRLHQYLPQDTFK